MTPSKGYLRVCLIDDTGAKRSIFVHALVLTAFVGPRPKGHVACHGNGIRDDNRLVNLRWDTPEANAADLAKHGSLKGQKNGRAKVTEKEASDIRSLRAAGVKVTVIAAKYGICKNSVGNISSGRTFQATSSKDGGAAIAHLAETLWQANGNSKLDWPQMTELRAMAASGQPTKVMADRFGISPDTVRKIVRGISNRPPSVATC